MKAPFHLWLVGILSLLWFAGGAYDYLMTQTGNVTYLDMLTPAQLEYLQSAPVWFTAAWATGVWLAVVGAVLILMRSRYAGTAFAVALVGFVVSAVYGYVLASPSALEIGSNVTTIMSLGVAASLLLMWFYSRAMTRRGVLR